MAEDAGKLEVEYVVISASAMRRLERLQTQLEKVEKAAEKQSKIMQKSFKQAGIAMAAFGAVAVGVLYSIIKSSSYASMWMDQLKYTMMRLADKILIMTGMKDDIDDLFRAAEKFLDLWEEGGLTYAITVTMTDFKDWWDDLSTTKKLIYAVVAAIGLFIIAGSALIVGVAWWGAFMGAAATAVAWLTGGTLIATTVLYGMAVAVGALVGIIGVWILTKFGVMEWFSDLGRGFREWNHWIRDAVIMTVGYFGAFGQAINDLVAGDFEFPRFHAAMDEIEATTRRVFGRAPKPMDNKAIDDCTKNVEDNVIDLDRAYEIMHDNEISWADKRKIRSLDIITNSLDDQNAAVLDNISDMGKANQRSGYVAQMGFTNEFDKIPDNVGYAMDFAATNVALGTDLINIAMKNMETQYFIDVTTRYDGKSMGGGSLSVSAGRESRIDKMIEAQKAGLTKGYYIVGGSAKIKVMISDIIASMGTPRSQLSDSMREARDKYNTSLAASGYATGGHVLRTGAVVVHQGEDIVNLNRMMSGAKKDSDRSITVNNTINITGGNLSNTFEANRVASVISKRMGDELQRISTSI